MAKPSKGDNKHTLQLTMDEFMIVYVAVSRMLDKINQRRANAEPFDSSDLQFTTFEFEVILAALSRALDQAEKRLRRLRRRPSRATPRRRAA